MNMVGVKAGRLSRTQGEEREHEERYTVAHHITRSLVRVSLTVVFWCSDYKDHVIIKVSDSAPACAHIRRPIIDFTFKSKPTPSKVPHQTTATNIYSIHKWPALRLGLFFEMVFDQSL